MRIRKKKHPAISLDETAEAGEEDSKWLMKMGGPNLRLSGVIDRINLERVIDQLPHGYKEMFVLHDVEGYEYNEIAQILGAPSGIPNPSYTRPEAAS